MLHFTFDWTFYPTGWQKDRGYRWNCFVPEGILVLFSFVSLPHFLKTWVHCWNQTCMCSFTFYFTWSTWLGKLTFSSSLKTYLKRSFYVAQVVHELLNVFLCSSWTIRALMLFTDNWKHFLFTPFCAFFYFANHVYRKDITNDILQIKV